MKTNEALAELDKAISAYSEAGGDQGAIVTGWVLSLSVMHPSLPGSDGYFATNSPGLPYHSQLGLLHAALEDKKATVLSNMLNEEKK
jgi:hypothetical protein